MKAKLLYFWELYKTKIILGGLVLICLMGFGIVYKISLSLKNSNEVVVSDFEDSFVKEEEDLISVDNEEEVNEEIKVEQNEKIKFYVDIKGEVKTPGVYILDEGSRVSDVIKKAGGLTKNADTSVNNLSKKIKDEMVIIIYSKEEIENFAKVKEDKDNLLEEIEKSDGDIVNDSLIQKEDFDTSYDKEEDIIDSSNSSNIEETKRISINVATKEELMSISGIGESKALAIIEYRIANGEFKKLEDLLEVSGIGNALFEKIKDFIKL